MAEFGKTQIGTDEDGAPNMVRKMTPDQIKEREDLNLANTAGSIARRASMARAFANDFSISPEHVVLSGHLNGSGGR